MKMRVRKIQADPYRFTVHLLWPVTPEQFTDYVRRKFRPDYPAPGDFGGICHKEEHDIIIGFADWNWNLDSFGDLVHELFHATRMILEDRGVNLSEETDEAYAYLQEAMLDKSLRVMKGRP